MTVLERIYGGTYSNSVCPFCCGEFPYRVVFLYVMMFAEGVILLFIGGHIMTLKELIQDTINEQVKDIEPPADLLQNVFAALGINTTQEDDASSDC